MQESYNEPIALLLPAAVFALSAGCSPFMLCYRGLSCAFEDASDPLTDSVCPN